MIDPGNPFGEAKLPTMPDNDAETEAHAEVAAVFEEIRDEKVLSAFLKRVIEAGKKARTGANIRPGRACIIREIDYRVWEKHHPDKAPPKEGTIYNTCKAGGDACHVGYNTLSVAFGRNPGSSLATIKGVTFEKL